MMNKWLVLIFLSFHLLQAQEGEYLIPVSNQKAKPVLKNGNLNLVYETDTIDLPFLDDFSTNLLSVQIDDTTGVNYSSDTTFTRTFNAVYYNSYTTLIAGDTSYLITYNNGTSTYDTIAQNPIEIIFYNYLIYPPIPTDTVYRFPNYNIITDDLGVVDTVYLTENDTTWQSDERIYYIIPDQGGLWTDRDVYINANYGIDPPTVGVATLDAVNEFGALHPGAGESSFYGDYFTSKPIDLSNYNPSDSVYLSFFFQPEGLGDSPDPSDSIILEFKTGESNWVWQWSNKGESLNEFEHGQYNQFKQIMLGITDTMFFKSSFQFRFKVICSLAGSLEPSWAGNADHWNLDYVYLNANRTISDIIRADVAFTEKPSSLLQSFTSTPWPHYLNKTEDLMIDSTFNLVFNNDNDPTPKNTAYQYEIRHQGNLETSSTEYAINLDPLTAFDFFGPINNYDFNSINEDSAVFEVIHYITTDQNDLKYNDTLKYYQKFHNYYAYDDGSSEAGYGINSEGGMVALKFKPITNIGDTLQAIQIYFNQVAGNANVNSFLLSVWNTNNSGKPASLLYQSGAISPQYSDSLNGFVTYELDTTLIISTEFCIGWEQFHDELLNVGFDRNTPTNGKLYYKILNTSGWQASSFSGTPMMRPVFGKPIPDPTGVKTIEKAKIMVELYPNPSNGDFTLAAVTDEPINYSIFNLSGQLVSQGQFTHQIQLSASDWTNGMYIIQLQAKGFSEYQKLLVKH